VLVFIAANPWLPHRGFLYFSLPYYTVAASRRSPEEVLAESDRLVAELDRKYPAPEAA